MAIWGDPKIELFWEKEKVDRTSDTNMKIESRRARDPELRTGPAERADAAEALESVSSRVPVWHVSSPDGAADSIAPRIPPGLNVGPLAC